MPTQAEVNRIIQAAIERQKRKIEELKAKPIDHDAATRHIQAFIRNTAGVGTLDVLGPNPTAYKIFDVLVEMSRDLEKDEPDKLHTVRLHGQPPVSKAEDARSCLFIFAFYFGVYMSEVGLAKLVLREE